MVKVENLQGNKIKILELVLKNEGDQLKLSCKIHCKNEVFRITFYNVSRFKIGEVSIPSEIHGFEIINHSKNAWEKDSKYEVRDFEDDRIHFFCECFDTDSL